MKWHRSLRSIKFHIYLLICHHVFENNQQNPASFDRFINLKYQFTFPFFCLPISLNFTSFSFFFSLLFFTGKFWPQFKAPCHISHLLDFKQYFFMTSRYSIFILQPHIQIANLQHGTNAIEAPFFLWLSRFHITFSKTHQSCLKPR